MKVMFVSNLYPPNAVGGYEELCWEVASRFVSLGHSVSVVTSAHGGEVASWPDQEVHQVLQLLIGKSVYHSFDGPRFRRATIHAQNTQAMTEAVKRIKPDIIFCWNLFALDAAFFDWFRACELPVVVMLTDNWLASMLNSEFVSEFFRQSVNGDVQEAHLLKNECFASAVPANVTAIFGSHFMREFYVAAGVSFQNDVVIHNGVNLRKDSAAPRTFQSLPAGSRVSLLFAGRVVDIKGAHTAVEALCHLRAQRPEIDWHLDLVGDARDVKYSQRLRELAAKKDSLDKLHFLGRVTPDALPEMFASHDIYLFPSLYEPFSLTLIHALSSGIPTVASRVGGNPEIVRDGETGLLFVKSDSKGLAAAVLRLTDDVALAERISKKGMIEAQRYSTERMIAEMETHLRTRCG